MRKLTTIPTKVGLTGIALYWAAMAALLLVGMKDNPKPKEKAEDEMVVEILAATAISVEPYKWECPTCSPIEQEALNTFQERGVTDKLALATLLGNIKHESQWKPKVCQGGAITGYHGCRTGGFGLIQWTTVGRYSGLGNFANRYGCDVNSSSCQLRYIFTEPAWQRAEAGFKTPGKTIESYMGNAYTWLGWGIHGHRTDYSYNYARQLV